MSMIDIAEVGRIGVITDQQPHMLPANAWSSSRNVRFEHGEARRFGGYQKIVDLTGAALWALPLQYGDFAYWITTSESEIYAWDGITNADITPAGGLTGTANDLWNGGVFAGIAVLNNGIDFPQYWAPGMATAQQLTNWDTRWKARVIRPYKNLLIAMQMTESGVEYPTRYRWSDIADPGTLPTWDDTDPSASAGSDVLEETQGYIIDGEGLRDYFIIYKEDACFTLQFIGGQFVLANRMLLKTRGMLTQRCAKEFYGRHCVLSNGDVFIHDGQSAKSIADSRVRRAIFDNIDSDNYAKSFIAPNYQRDEMWICYPTSGEVYPNRAAVWNWTDDTWSFRDLPNAPHMAYGVLPSVTEKTWDTVTDTWDTATDAWNTRLYNPADRQLVMLSQGPGLTPSASLTPSATLTPTDGASRFFAMDVGFTCEGVETDCRVQRRGLKPERGDGVFRLRAAYPRCEGGQFTFRFGRQNSPNSQVSWVNEVTYTPGGTSDKIDLRVTGRYFAVEVIYPGATDGRFEGLTLDLVKVGTR